ncbi:MAG: Cna B-type domain-containing protein, partial [Christensenellales bacterium]|nr:Cna B-type domain-containing protein [Christensenellales bacterium]
MKKRIIAMLLVVLMLGQMMPINALAEGWNMIVSNEARGATYATVTFQYPIYQVNEDGTETVGSYGTIATQLVKVGEPPVQPNIPNLTGRKFERWTDEAGGTLDIHAPVQADTVFRAAYSKLEKRTVTIHYVFDVDGSMALEPYVAEFTAGTDVQLSVTSPALSGFVPEQETVTVDIPNIQEDAEYTVKYTGAPTSYTVRYHFQNVADNGYTADGFNRDAVHGHTIDDNIGAGETGWIDVGPYTITQYPEGTEHAGQPVIAGGMTEVRDFEIEGFVQQEIVQRRVMPNGRTVVDVYYNRELHTYTIDNDGGTAVDSRTLRYGSSLGLPDPSEMERPGYEFVGFFSKNYAFQNGKWVQVLGEQKHDSSCKMPPYDFTIEVRWQPVQQADYKVVYWVQSVKDAYNAPNENKTYDFLDAQTFTGTVGQKPTVNQVRPQDNGLNGTFFELNAERSEIGGIRENNWTGYYAESTKEIAPDGSTVINVYFDRQTVKLEFGHYERGWNRRWVVDYERVGLYGQNWRDAGYGTNGWPGGRWSDESGLGKGNWTYLDGFNHEDLTSTSVRLVNNDSNGRKDIYQYIEAQDSTPDNRKWIEADHYEQGQNDFNLSSKFLPGFTLYGYNTTTPEEEIRQASAGTSVSYNSRLNVFSTRNSFTLTFGNCADGSMPEQTYKYEEVLIKPETVPQRPDNVEADWEFKGWCLDAAGQVPVAWGTQTMPAANMVVYAKWAPPTYTVTYVDVRRNTVDTEQEVHTYPFEAEKFGTIMGPELEELEKQYVIDQTKYVDQDDRLTYTFMGWFIDENGTVRWNPATPITADREVYAKWEPSGTVWYRYVFLGMGDGVTEELGKWPATPFEETVWPDRPYGTFAQAAEDFAAAGMTDFPEFEGWRPMSTLSTTREKLTEQYQEIPVYYVPTSTWPLTIHYVDGETGKNLLPDEKHDLTEYAKVYSYQRIEGYTLTSAPQVRATKDDAKGPDGRVHITFTYKAVRHLPYRVEYYQENLNGGYDLLPNETVTYTEETSRWYLGETAEAQTADYKTFTGFTRNDSHKDAVTKVILREDQDNVLKLYYDRNSYTVTYIYGNAKPENAPDVPAQQTYKYGATVTVAAKPEASGYVFNGWHAFTSGTPVSGSFDMPAMNVVFQGNWAADTDTAYQVHFFFQNEDGTYPTETPAKVTRGGTTDTQASVTESDKADKRLGGSLLYRFDADHAQNVLTGTIAADGSLVLKLYFERVTANYTVHHYLDGTTVSVAADETLSAQVGARVTGKQATAFLDGFAEAKVVRAEPVNATITLVEDAAQNVITFYYRMPLTLKAFSATKNYDGTALTEDGFTVMNPQNLVNGDKAEDITLKMTGDSSITNPGTEPNEIDPATIRFAGQAVPAYYDITLQEGLLVVVQRLNVRKTITQPAEALPGEGGDALNIPVFSFTLNRDGQPVANALYTAGSRTAATDERGVFTLNAGETATFTALEPGEYTVVEAYNGDWIPDGDGLLTRRATLGTSGAGDVTVSFNNHRIVNGEITLTKTWVDGNGTAAQRPDTLALKLIGTAKGVEVYRAPVTLTAQDGWTRKVSNLPMRLNGEMIEYRLIETDVPDGYTAIMDGLTVTNAVNTRNDLTITGTKTWVDGERAHNNATDLTLTLQRSVNNGPWATFNPGQANFAWTGDAYAFTSLPSHDTNGYAYAYRVVEKVTGQNLPPYTVSYTGADGQENGGVASFDENGSATVNLTNTIVDNNDRYLYGTKTWLDGGQTHDNATELTLTLARRSTKPGSEWEHDFVDEGGFLFGWTADRPEQYGFDDLERYDAEGYAYEYRVTETINDPEKAKLYETTYSPADGVSTTTKRQVNITNTLIDPNNVTVSGTKTWVDGGQTHDNATELTLTLTRTSAKQGAKPETVAVVPAWEGNTYTFTNLEQYDAEGYAYTYDVTEAPVEGYTTTQDGYNFTNTIIDPNNVTVSGTKTWVDGGQTHDNADELTLTLTRTSAKQGAKVETVAVV